MAKMSGTDPWVHELCLALGEDPKGVKSITIRIAVGEIVSATIEKYVDRENTHFLETIRKVGWKEQPCHC